MGESKTKRSRAGCETCRARKVRCDERHPICYNCDRLGLPCTPPGNTKDPSLAASPQAETNGAYTGTGLKRKRTYRSCAECRTSKTRCSGHKPTCVRCGEKKLACTYEDDSEPAWKQRVAMTTGVSEQGSPPVVCVVRIAISPHEAIAFPSQRADRLRGRGQHIRRRGRRSFAGPSRQEHHVVELILSPSCLFQEFERIDYAKVSCRALHRYFNRSLADKFRSLMEPHRMR